MQVKGDLIADLTEDLAADATNSQGQHFYPSILSWNLSLLTDSNIILSYFFSFVKPPFFNFSTDERRKLDEKSGGRMGEIPE